MNLSFKVFLQNFVNFKGIFCCIQHNFILLKEKISFKKNVEIKLKTANKYRAYS